MKDEFNKDQPVKEEKNVSEKELNERIENISKVAPTNELRFETLRMREEYTRYQATNESTRFTQDIHFIQGQRIGLHRNQSLDGLKVQREAQDERFRNQLMGKVKHYYHDNFSLSKNFNEIGKQVGKDKFFEKE